MTAVDLENSRLIAEIEIEDEFAPIWNGNRYPQVRGRQEPLVGGARVPMPRPYPPEGQGLAP